MRAAIGSLTMRRWTIVLVAAVALAGCGDDGDDGADADAFQFQEDAPEKAEHWADVWCDIDGSMTREDVIALMGEPTSEFDAESGAQPQSQWDTGEFDYTAFYDATGHVEQAYVNPLSIQEAGIPKPFDCPLVRHL
jgi:hypothetical protein